MKKESIFLNLPLPLKKVGANIAGLIEANTRYGSYFENFKNNFKNDETRENLTKGRALEIVNDHPFYKNNKINRFEDIPIINRDIVVENYSKFETEHQAYKILGTSGTSGQSLKVPVSKKFLQKKFASAWYFREINGLYRNEIQANFFGRTIFKNEKTKPPYWLYSYPTNQLLFSQYHLTKNTAASYLQALKEYNVKWFHGYPSFVSLFANYLNELNFISKARSLHIKGITVSSETLSEKQRNIIEKVFNTPVRNFYGQVEGVADIYENSIGKLKVNKGFSYVEFIPHKQEENIYRIVGTQVDNECMPLIRYDTGDLVELMEDDEENKHIKRIIGRQDDYLLLKDGRKAGRLGHIFKNTSNIKEAQILQEKAGEALFFINKMEQFGKDDLEKLKNEIVTKLGKDFTFEVKFVEKIPRTSSGKLKLVVSKID